VIDAAGAIYVIGGDNNGDTKHNDVWVSTDGGARAELALGVGRGGYPVGIPGKLRGTRLPQGVLQGY
jgi:hypothetical protein